MRIDEITTNDFLTGGTFRLLFAKSAKLRSQVRWLGFALGVISSLATSSGEAEAGFFDYYGVVRVGRYFSYQSQLATNDLIRPVVEFTSDGNTGWAASARSSIELTSDGLALGVSASAANIAHNVPSEWAGGYASWRDIISLPSATQADAVRVNFEVHGMLGSDAGGLTTSARVYFEALDGLDGTADMHFSLPNWLFYGPGERDAGPREVKLNTYGSDRQLTSGSGWDELILTPSSDGTSFSFDGMFHVYSHYDERFGGFPFQVALLSEGQVSIPERGLYGAAFADASHTLRIASATLGDDTPIDVTFDSGLRLIGANAVPEPGSFVLLGTVGLSLLAMLRRKRIEQSV